MSYQPEFAELLNHYLGNRDRTPAWLARRLDIHPGTVGRWLNQGARPGSPEMVMRIADVLSIHDSAERQSFQYAAGYGYLDGSRESPRQRQNAPSPLSSSDRTDNLPASSTSFVGREHELNQIADRIADPTVRLLTLVGPGGIGKTRLALEAARNQVGRYADGVWFVPLAVVDDASQIPATILEALSIKGISGDDAESALIKVLRNKQTLLLLDNLEHLPRVADLVARLLDHTGNVKILATSREPLALLEEWVIALGGLTVPGPDEAENDAEIEEYSAVRLLVERARRIRPGLEITEETRRELAELARLVGGHPLAIEMAASWLRSLSLPLLLDELRSSLDILEMNARNVTDRHRSIGAVFETSWRRLDHKEQAILLSLSVFEGGFDRGAVEAVAGASLRTLSEMVDASWVQAARGDWFDLHPLVRAYLREKNEREGAAFGVDIADLEDRHSAWFAEISSDYDVSPERLLASAPNIRRGMYRAFQNLDYPLISKYNERLVAATWDDVPRPEMSAAIEEALTHLETQRRVDISTDDQHRLRAHLLASRGYHARRNGHYQPSENWMRAAISELDAIDDHDSELRATIAFMLGWVLLAQCRYLETDRVFEETLQISERHHYPRVSALVHRFLGNSAKSQGRYDRALALFAKMYEAAETHQIPEMAYHTGPWGVALDRGHVDEAEAERAKIATNPRFIGGAGLYELYASQHELLLGNLQSARSYGQQALAISEELMNRVRQLWSLNALGDIELSAGDPTSAQAYFDQGLNLAESIGYKKDVGHARTGLGLIALERNDLERARELFIAALSQTWPDGMAPEALSALVGLAQVEAESGRRENATSWLRIALAHPAMLHSTRIRAEALYTELSCADEYSEQKTWTEAQEDLRPIIDSILDGSSTANQINTPLSP